jgi:hypothetical protein
MNVIASELRGLRKQAPVSVAISNNGQASKPA